MNRTCLDACRERGYDDAIEYGISAEYARTRQWGWWEIFREFMQNALDEQHYVTGVVPDRYLCRDEDGSTLIYDEGRGISVDNLLLGVSRKEPWQRGKFGEGMKLSMLGALVLDLRITIRSRDKLIEPIIVRRVYEDVPVEVFCACIKRGLQPMTGTTVRIEGAELCRLFQFHVVQGIAEINPNCILYSLRLNGRQWRDVIDSACTGFEGVIFLRDLFVSRAVDVFPGIYNSVFSYNLFNVEIDESRKVPSASSVLGDIRYLWVLIVNQIPKNGVARQLFRHMVSEVINRVLEGERKPYLEAHISIEPWVLEPGVREVVNDIFNELYGEDAVVVNSPSYVEYAEYLGLRPIYCYHDLCLSLAKITDTEGRMANKQRGYLRQIVDIERSMPEFYEVVKALEDIGDVLLEYRKKPNPRIYYALLDPDKGGQSMEDNTILINLLLLLDRCGQSSRKCLSFFLGALAHEIAHLKCNLCADTSDEFPRTLTGVAGDMAANAIMRRDILSESVKRFYDAYKRWVETKGRGGG
jgi:hypothetical protein